MQEAGARSRIAATGGQGAEARALLPTRTAQELEQRPKRQPHRRVVTLRKPSAVIEELGPSETARMKCIAARRTLAPPHSPQGLVLPHPCSPGAEPSREAPTAGRVRVGKQQK